MYELNYSSNSYIGASWVLLCRRMAMVMLLQKYKQRKFLQRQWRFLQKQRTGGKRLVIDFRKLNAQTLHDNFPLPNIDLQMENLAGSSIFAVLDLANGFLQIPLSDEAKEKTAFVTPDDTGQFFWRNLSRYAEPALPGQRIQKEKQIFFPSIFGWERPRENDRTNCTVCQQI